MPDRPDIYIDYKGWRWRAPFACMYCGVETSAEQWAFSRSCGGCDVSKSHTARLSIFDPRIFAGPHELIDPNDSHFLVEERFLSPADAERYPVRNPPKPIPPSIHFGQYSCDQSDAVRTLGRACNCTCLHTVHPVANHSPGCPEFALAVTPA